MESEIKVDGVLEPLTIILAEFAHRDGDDPVIVPVSVDGSTRTTHCHDLSGFDPIEVVYGLPQAPAREWKSRLQQIIRVQDLTESESTEEEVVAHRSLVCQARILVGIESVRSGPPVSVVEANRAIVGGIHVNHPQEWPDGSQMDEIADAVLHRLVKDERIKPADRDFMAGLVHSDEAKKSELPQHVDERAAVIAHTLWARRNAASIGAGYRGLIDKKRLGNNDKTFIAVELIMRSFRDRHPTAGVRAIRSALERTINMPSLPTYVRHGTPKELE